MALADDVTARLSTTRLQQLTNPDDPTASAVDTTRLGLACTDAQAEFETVAGIAYDSTVARHTALGVRGAIIYLEKFIGLDGGEWRESHDRWIADMERLRNRTHNAWIAPQTSSNLEPSREPSDETTRPDFDLETFAEFRPERPNG